MQLASSARLPDGLLAAQWLGAEKPHQGVSTQKQAWHPAPSVCNSTTALGLRAGCAGNRVRSFCSGEQYDSDLGLYYLRARYYNPATGRFLSRDPEDGEAFEPASLPKYLYASGDPVNGWDPTGRDNIFQRALIATWDYLKARFVLTPIRVALIACFAAVTKVLDDAVTQNSGGKARAGGLLGFGCTALWILWNGVG